MKLRVGNKLPRSRCSMTKITILFLLLGSAVAISGEVKPDKVKSFEEIKDVEYDEFNDTAVYNSSTEFDSHGMSGLYDLTNSFIKALLPGVIPKDALTVANGSPEISDSSKLIDHFSGLIAFYACLLVFAILTPLCGLFFCCCRCCGNCGGKTTPLETDEGNCKMIVYSTILLILGGMLLFGAVGALVSNDNMQEGTVKLTNSLNVSVEDASTFFDSTKGQVLHLLTHNLEQFQKAMLELLHKGGDVLFDELAKITKVDSISDAQKIVTGLEDVKENLITIGKLTDQVKTNAKSFQNGLQEVKHDLTGILASCGQMCEGQLDTSMLDKEINLTGIPDLTKEIDILEDFTRNGVLGKINDGVDKINKIKENINTQVKANMQKAEKAIDDTMIQIGEQRNDVVETMDTTKDKVKQTASDNLKIADDFIKENGPIAYYLDLLVACVLVIIFACFILGIGFGLFGKRPKERDSDCCNKGIGSGFLITGVILMFIISFISVLIVILHSVGMFAQVVVCEPIRQPADNDLMEFIDKLIESQIDLNITLSSVLTNCYANKTAFEVFNLESKLDLNKIKNYVKEMDIEEILNQVKTAINDVSIDINVLLPQEQKDEIKKLAAQITDMKFDELSDISKELQSFSFRPFLDQLIEFIEFVNPIRPDLAEELKQCKNKIQKIIDESFDPMLNNVNKIVTLVNSTTELLKFDSETFEKAVEKLLDNIEEAENTLKDTNKIKEQLLDITESFCKLVIRQVQDFLDLIVNSFKGSIGNCAPLAIIINGTMTATCDEIFLPMNSYWFSIFWSLTLFIPCIIISTMLAYQFKKFEKNVAHYKNQGNVQMINGGGYPTDNSPYGFDPNTNRSPYANNGNHTSNVGKTYF